MFDSYRLRYISSYKYLKIDFVEVYIVKLYICACANSMCIFGGLGSMAISSKSLVCNWELVVVAIVRYVFFGID